MLKVKIFKMSGNENIVEYNKYRSLVPELDLNKCRVIDTPDSICIFYEDDTDPLANLKEEKKQSFFEGTKAGAKMVLNDMIDIVTQLSETHVIVPTETVLELLQEKAKWYK